MMRAIAIPLLLAFVLSLAVVPVCRRLAERFGFFAHPIPDRWHRQPVALFGGAAIAAVVFGCSMAYGLPWRIPVLIAASGVMFLVGVFDDVLSLKPATKLIAQIALASMLLFFGYRLNWLQSMPLDALLTLVWVVGLTNAFNLIDNMDGLCAGITLIAGTALLVDLFPAADAHTLFEAQYLSILIGATAGFLVYNLHPASIFMGDSGSLFLGFSFAAVALGTSLPNRGRPDVLPIIVGPVLVLLLPIFDTALVTISRWVSGRRASEGGRDHSSHRLVAIGLSERRAVAVLWTLAAVGGMLGIGVARFGHKWSVLLAAAAFLIGMVLFAAYLTGIRVYDDADVRARPGTLTPIIVEFMHKRRVAEVLLDFCLVVLCYYTAYRLRFEDPVEFRRNVDLLTQSLPVIVASQMVAFFVVGVYRGVWRHFGMMDTLVVARGVSFGTAAALLVILGVYRFQAYSRTVFAIYAMLLLVAITLSRASFRLVAEFMRRQRVSECGVVIYGAGDAAGLVMRELLSGHGVRIVGFIDDDPRKAGSRVNGYPVLGGYSALTVLLKAASVDAVVVSARKMPPERLNNLEVLCMEHNVRLSRLRVDLELLVSSPEESEESPVAPHTHLRQIKS
jgi:UDP-GlcNAc:undecaprenyl-phosphate/decaprenyl-phosphate GlcNAc-1-phosphate transferase